MSRKAVELSYNKGKKELSLNAKADLGLDLCAKRKKML